MKKSIAMTAMFLMAMAASPVPVFCGTFTAASWQPVMEAQGIAYAFTPVGIVHVGDHVQVRVRSVEPTGVEKERVTTILYDLNCRQRTFRMLEVMEEHAGLRSVRTTPSGDFPIQPGKHPHLEKLHRRFCP